eukprot:365154-Chlamydomonas_euryale.AAC.20
MARSHTTTGSRPDLSRTRAGQTVGGGRGWVGVGCCAPAGCWPAGAAQPIGWSRRFSAAGAGGGRRPHRRHPPATRARPWQVWAGADRPTAPALSPVPTPDAPPRAQQHPRRPAQAQRNAGAHADLPFAPFLPTLLINLHRNARAVQFPASSRPCSSRLRVTRLARNPLDAEGRPPRRRQHETNAAAAPPPFRSRLTQRAPTSRPALRQRARAAHYTAAGLQRAARTGGSARSGRPHPPQGAPWPAAWTDNPSTPPLAPLFCLPPPPSRLLPPTALALHPS